ncbi:hypothetical protein Pst134EA_009488 [Puccinia striiformis f. sp. tritici]|uniref:hypothetical protein n=1 Tax=Puccinia striiformis f. sp. tritici TaxID=168172 RepID=UPI0020082A80|nr:hypothetical protein Pst134EA_009488 [Puccinia striiformis f. sp. tritici]KAH9468964.1 hypothetical protein Pst134EA_009488 [Puccinia striiformis f. sp. tritici]
MFDPSGSSTICPSSSPHNLRGKNRADSIVYISIESSIRASVIVAVARHSIIAGSGGSLPVDGDFWRLSSGALNWATLGSGCRKDDGGVLRVGAEPLQPASASKKGMFPRQCGAGEDSALFKLVHR